jgi:hypothetical protein
MPWENGQYGLQSGDKKFLKRLKFSYGDESIMLWLQNKTNGSTI